VSSIDQMSESEPLVSIIAPTYRHGAFLREAVESVVNQSYGNWELLVREDGDPDETVLRGIDDPRVRYTGQERRGLWRLHETYNELLKEAKGDLIAILEGDDRWPSNKLARQVDAHRRHPDVIVSFGEAVRIDERGSELSRWTLDDVPIGEPFDALPFLVRGCPIAAVTAMVRRDALIGVNGFSQPPRMPAVDYSTWMALASVGPFLALPVVLGHWRVHRRNASTEHIVELARASRALALAHVDEGDAKAVGSHWDQVEADVLLSVGRSALERADWPTARGAFKAALRLRARRSPKLLAKGTAGLALATMHVPLRTRRTAA
jgi:glycosyltransferase involved in cell wall biosynthesis